MCDACNELTATILSEIILENNDARNILEKVFCRKIIKSDIACRYLITPRKKEKKKEKRERERERERERRKENAERLLILINAGFALIQI